jgi:hypothetical protein
VKPLVCRGCGGEGAVRGIRGGARALACNSACGRSAGCGAWERVQRRPATESVGRDTWRGFGKTEGWNEGCGRGVAERAFCVQGGCLEAAPRAAAAQTLGKRRASQHNHPSRNKDEGVYIVCEWYSGKLQREVKAKRG